MKNIEIGFYSLKKTGYFSLHIGGNGNSVEVFRLFSMNLKDKAFKYHKNQTFFLAISSVTFYMYLNIGRDDGDDYNDRESKIIMSKMMMNNMRYLARDKQIVV